MVTARQTTSAVAAGAIRPARWLDVWRIWRAHRASFPHPYPLWRMIHYQASAQSCMFVATEGSRLAGYVIATSSTYAHPARLVGEIISLAVLPPWRRRGLGRRLLTTAVDWLTAEGRREIYLQVAVSNTAAQALYAQFGFDTVERLRRYYVDGEDAWLLRLTPDSRRAATPPP